MQPPNPYAHRPQPMVQSVRPRAEQRGVAMIVVGCVLAAIGCLAFFLFAYNAYRYTTFDDHFSGWPVPLSVALRLKRAYRMRIAIFGGVALVFGGAGFALGLFGVRRR